MKWWRKLFVNQGAGMQLILTARYKRKRRLIVLRFGPSPGRDLLADDKFLWEYSQRHPE